MDYLDKKTYSLKEVSRIITDSMGGKHSKCTKKNIIELAKEGEIQLCINKPDWKYVRLDEKDNEMEKLYCKPLNTWLIVPVDRHCTGTADGVELMWNKPPTPHLRQTDICSMYANNKKEIFIDSHNMTAEYEGEIIRVSKVGYARLPEPEDNNYQDFEQWLWGYRMRVGDPSESKKVKTLTIYGLQENSNFFFSLVGVQGRGVSINQKELCVTRQELDRVVTKSPVKEPQPEPVEVQKNKSPTEEKRRSALIKWLDEQSDNFDPLNHDMTKEQVWNACNIYGVCTEKTGRTFSAYNRDLIKYKGNRPTK